MSSLSQAARFLYGVRAVRDDGSDAGGADRSAAGWVRWITPLGLLVGVLLAAVLAVGWSQLTHGPGELWMVAVPAVLIYWLGPGAARYAGWGRTWTSVRLGARLNDLSRDAYPGIEGLGLMVIAIVAAAMTQFAAVSMLPVRLPTTPPGLPSQFMPIYYCLFPATHYGAVVLMCLWGNAAVLLAACLGRPAGHADRLVRELLAAPAWRKMAWALLFPAAVSAVFFFGWFRQWGQDWLPTAALSVFYALAVAVILFGVTMLFAWLLARRVQGHCRSTLLAAGLIGEIAFLLVFHAMFK